MKTKKTILLILSILCLLNAKIYAQGTSCANATALSGKGTNADFAFPQKSQAAFFSFVARSARMDIQVDRTISAVDTPFVHVDSLLLYSGTCSGLTLLQYSIKHDTALYDSLPDIQALNLTVGTTYYVEVKRVLKPGDESVPYFRLNQTYLAAAIKPACANGLCGPNLLCNGDFENTPAWASATNYQDNSDVFRATAPGAAESSYCMSSPNMRFYTVFNGGFAPCAGKTGDYDFTDIYKIGTSMGTGFNNTAESGLWFMGVDCPSDYCYECSSNPNTCSSTLNTPNYTCTAWQETVPVTPGTQYVFEAWVEALDGEPGATVSMEINGAAPFFQDIVTRPDYNSWVKVCYNWTAPTGVTSALIQIFGQGTSSSAGYDFGLDNISFGTSSPMALSPISLNSPTTCAGTSTALMATPATTGATYTWSTGVTTTTNSINVSPTTTTTYSVTEFSGKCQSTATCTVTVSPQPTILFGTRPACGKSCDGNATATVTGGTAPYTYSWSNGATTASIASLCAGSYSVTVTDAHGCTVTGNIIITSIPIPAVTATSATICTGSNATICANGALSYTWNTAATTQCITVSPTTTTTYSVVGTNRFCSASATSTVTVEPAPSICLPSSTEICPGTCTTLSALCIRIKQSGITYTWAPATGLSATTGSAVIVCPTANTVYTVTATNTVTGCSSTATETVTLYPAPVIVLSTTPTCSGMCSATATATITTGTAPYTYSWSNGQTTATATGLCAGTYTLTVTDGNGCVTTKTIRIFAVGPPVVHATSTTICSGAPATVCATGFGSSYTWNTGATTPCITVYPHTTTIYTVTASNSACTTTATSTVTVDPTPSVCLPSSVEICPGTCTTLDALCVKIKQSGVTYTWAPAMGLSATTGAFVTACPTANTVYTVTATNTVTGCSSTATETVTLYPAPTIVISTTPTCVGMCNATATATITSGTAPYTYSWSNGQTTATATGLCAGTYTLTVTDGNGCVTTKTIRIFAVGPPVVHATSATICSGAPATVCATGFGSSYTWNTGATTPCITVYPHTTTIYTVTASNGACTATATSTVTVNPTPSICLPSSVEICPGTCTTLDALCVKIKQSGVTYTWAPAMGLSATTGAFVTACPTANTVYTVTATNTVTGCSSTATETVTLYPAPTIVISTTPTCVGMCNATATATITSGTAPYTYSWSNGQTTATATGLCAGTYTLTVTDGNGCVTTKTIRIFVEEPLPVHVTSATICAGASATICATGFSPSYTWNTGATTACITVSPAVTTTYTVTGSNGVCTANATSTVTVEPHLVVTATATPTCSKSCTGTAAASVTSGAAPYTYSWATGGQTTASISNLCGGNYTVTATDAHGCTGSAVINVPYVFPPSITVSSATVCPGSSATLCATGATSFVWNTGVTTACIIVSPTVTTSYTVTGSNNANGFCPGTAIGVVTIDHPIVTTTSTPSCLKFCNGTATASATGAIAPYTYSWSNGATTASIANLCGGNYTVTVTDAHGCTSTATVTVPIISPPVITVTSATICAGSSATICASGVSNFAWSNGATTACITVSPTTTTTYTVTGSNGVNGSCSATGTGTVTVNPLPGLCMTNEVVVCPNQCATISGACLSSDVHAAESTINYSWSPTTGISGSTNTLTVTVCPTVTTVYTLTATNTTTGCTAVGTTKVDVFPSTLTITGPTSIGCGTTNTYSVSPVLPAPVTYQWFTTNPTASGTGTSATVIFGSTSGTISWAVVDPQGCKASVQETVKCINSEGPDPSENTGLGTLTDKKVTVYPNPAGEILNVQTELQPNEQLNMCMYNNLGEVIKCETLKTDVSTISTSMLPAGIYFYRITNTDGTLIKADKVMIVH